MAVGLALVVAGCGGSSPPVTPEATATEAAQPTPSAQATTTAGEPSQATTATTPEAGTGASVSGITVLVCDAPQFQETAYEVSVAGRSVRALGTWTFGTPVVSAFGCSPDEDGWFVRQQFNVDFSALAVIDNGVPAVEDRSGRVRDVGAPAPDGFGASTPAAKTPLFRPGTSQLWYADGNDGDKLYSIETSANAAPVARRVSSFQGSYLFSPEGNVIVTGGSYLLMTPDNRHGVERGGNRLEAADRSLATTPSNGINFPELPLTGTLRGCHPELFIAPRTVLCDLHALTFSPSFTSFRQERFLPPVAPNTSTRSPLLSPDGSRVAFLSTSSSRDTAIWTVGTHGGTPVKLVDVTNLGDSSTLALLEWK